MANGRPSIAGNRFSVHKTIYQSDEISISICTDNASDDNTLYTVNEYRSNALKNKASDACKPLDPEQHTDFYEMVLHNNVLYVVFRYYNGVLLRHYLETNNPSIVQRLQLGDKVIKKAVAINHYPPIIRISAMQLKNLVVRKDGSIATNFFLDFDNVLDLMTETKYISSAGNVLYELFADAENCPNQIDAYIVKAAFGRYASLEKLSLEYSAIKSEIMELYEEENDEEDDRQDQKSGEKKERSKPFFPKRNKSRDKEPPLDVPLQSMKKEVPEKESEQTEEVPKPPSREEEEQPDDDPVQENTSADKHEKHDKKQKAKPKKSSRLTPAHQAKAKRKEPTDTQEQILDKKDSSLRHVRKKLRFPIKTVSVFLLISILLVTVIALLNQQIMVASSKNTEISEIDITDSGRLHTITVEGIDDPKIETPGQDDEDEDQTDTDPIDEEPTETDPVDEEPSQPDEPIETDEPTEPADPTVIEYTVRAGDFLRKIAEEFYGSGDYYTKIMEYNDLEDTVLHVGQTLLIPPLSDDPETTIMLYTVQSGDTLIAIARRVYDDASLYTIFFDYNDLPEDGTIYVGQVLRYPVPPPG